ncbi:MAG: asparaginase domain-containing protein [Owenweeksia sp.]|nr:asparaginase domain-containing protein [Owenweeksia sp.]
MRLARRIIQDYDRYDGFVILHGQDTMAYSASALSFLLENLAKPVIFTVHELPIGIPRSDARENLLTTIEIVLARRSDNLAMIPEVGIYFEYDLFRGNRTHKTSTEDFEAFISPNYPKLAEAGVHLKYNSAYIRSPAKDALVLHEKLETEIGILTTFPGMTESYVSAILSQKHMRALIIRSFGNGNVPTG